MINGCGLIVSCHDLKGPQTLISRVDGGRVAPPASRDAGLLGSGFAGFQDAGLLGSVFRDAGLLGFRVLPSGMINGCGLIVSCHDLKRPQALISRVDGAARGVRRRVWPARVGLPGELCGPPECGPPECGRPELGAPRPGATSRDQDVRPSGRAPPHQPAALACLSPDSRACTGATLSRRRHQCRARSAASVRIWAGPWASRTWCISGRPGRASRDCRPAHRRSGAGPAGSAIAS